MKRLFAAERLHCAPSDVCSECEERLRGKGSNPYCKPCVNALHRARRAERKLSDGTKLLTTGELTKFAPRVSPYEDAKTHLEAHVAALKDPVLGPKIIAAAMDDAMTKAVDNMTRFGRPVMSGVGAFKEPYGEYRDPIEVLFDKLRKVVP